jgi:hypothetical protein
LPARLSVSISLLKLESSGATGRRFDGDRTGHISLPATRGRDSFVLNGDPTVKQFGIGLAVAVILDATIARWLGRLLPRTSIEGEECFRARDRLAARRHPAGIP